MRFKDMLLYIDSYPEPVAHEAIDQAVSFAAALGADLAALAVQVDLRTPSNYLADHWIGLSGLCADQEEKSLVAARQSVQHFEAACAKRKVRGQGQIVKVDMYRVGERLAGHARTRDLCLIPIAERLAEERSVAESVVFGSGRPVVVYRPTGRHLMSRGLDAVVIAWDGSQHAARALADALPILPNARQVRILTVLDDKPETREGATQDAARHLRVHGIEAITDEVQSAGRKTGDVIADYAVKHDADLIVMGAYGRSRLREFVLGGATQSLLTDLKAPLFLSR